MIFSAFATVDDTRYLAFAALPTFAAIVSHSKMMLQKRQALINILGLKSFGGVQDGR
jgi:hypothetical protein